MNEIRNSDELAALPNMSVVQFRGTGLGAHSRLVWQLDDEWFSPGSTESVATSYFPPEAFPAVVLWQPIPTNSQQAPDVAAVEMVTPA